MTLIRSLLVAAATTFCATLTAAGTANAHDGVHINDAYARASTSSGAVFFEIENHQLEDDRLISVASNAAKKVELHTHKAGADGVMQMIAVPEGLMIPGNGSQILGRGGDHVMLMGLVAPLATGDTVSLTLTFERAGVVVLEVPVDNERTDAAMDHSGHGKPAPTN